mgnify:CR=1 FL=1
MEPVLFIRKLPEEVYVLLFDELDAAKYSAEQYKKWKKDPTDFRIYHHLHDEASKTWTVVPSKEMIRKVKLLSERWAIGDFGCGQAFLHEDFPYWLFLRVAKVN